MARAGFEAYLDKKDILPGEPWKERLAGLILTADAVAFLISPDSIASDICAWEVDETERLKKRILPVLHRTVSDDQVPQRLSRLNYILLRPEDHFDSGVGVLAEAVETDIAWVRHHTRMGELARRWEDAGRPSAGGRLMRGEELAEAEKWLIASPKSAPEPTDEQRAYVQTIRSFESAEIEKERVQIARTRRFQKRASVALVALALLMLTGLVGLIWQDIETTRREQTVFVNPVDAALRGQRYDRAMRYGLQTFPAEGAMPWTPVSTAIEGKLAGAALLNQLSFATVGHTGPVRTAKFSPDGKRFVTASDDGTARVWDVATGKETALLRGHTKPVNSAEFSPDGARIVTASRDMSALVWDSSTGNKLVVLSGHTLGVHSAHFSPDGAQVLTASGDKTVRIWDAASGKELGIQKVPDGIAILSTAAFSPDGRRVVSVWSEGARLWNMASNSDPVRLSKNVVHYAGFSPDSTKVLVGYAAFGPFGRQCSALGRRNGNGKVAAR